MGKLKVFSCFKSLRRPKAKTEVQPVKVEAPPESPVVEMPKVELPPPPPYNDDVQPVATREHAGCFTVDQVRGSLGQPALTPEPKDKGTLAHAHEGFEATPENHFLYDCVCAPLHTRCSPETAHMPDSGMNAVELTIEQLRESAVRGCWFCSVFYGGIKAAPAWDPALESEMPIKPSFSVRDPILPKFDFSAQVFGDQDRVQEQPLVFYIDANEATTSPCQLLRVRQQPVHAEPRDQVYFTKRLLEQCSVAHSCSPQTSSFMPKRLLHVQVVDGKYAVRLIKDAAPAQYVTLSYTRGNNLPERAKTTRANIDLRMGGLLWKDIPQTFRDAIAMTEQLGYEYLWIDALCIMQDLPSDWEAEVSQMSSIFSSCALMLSADASPDADAGLFRSAKIATKPWRPEMTTEWRDSGVRVHYPKVHCTFGKTSAMYAPSWKQDQLYPLSTRAWAYQEQYLARRVVHFGVDEISWDCCGGNECQCGKFGPDGSQFTANIVQKTLVDKECSTREKHSLWLNAVTAYSERELSNWGDRLPAISGLAKQFMATGQPKSPIENDGASLVSDGLTRRPFRDIQMGEYLAGLWSNFLPQGLAWAADHTPGRQISSESEYTTPSWSWASVTGTVHWTLSHERPCSEVVISRCYPTGSDPTGRISRGEIFIKTKIIPVKLFSGEVEVRTKKGKKYGFMHAEAHDPATGEQTSLGEYRPDYAPTGSEVPFKAGSHLAWGDADVWSKEMLPIEGAFYGLHINEVFVMIVKATSDDKGSGVYERVGCVALRKDKSGKYCDMSKWFGGVETEVARLI